MKKITALFLLAFFCFVIGLASSRPASPGTMTEPAAGFAQRESGRLDAFDSAIADWQKKSNDLFELAGTAESWTKSQVQFGLGWQIKNGSALIQTTRALLEAAEVENRALREQVRRLQGDRGEVDDDDDQGDVGQGEEPPAANVLNYTESAPFRDGNKYAWLEDLTEPERTGAALGGDQSLWMAGWNSANIVKFPASLSGRTIVWNSTEAPWGNDYGPLWGIRSYNVGGTLRDFTQYRVGDFHKGREGHAIYLNVYGDVLLERVIAKQCGAQFAQIVWRPGETKIKPELWDHADRTVRIVDCASIDNGAINEGNAVRASWPLAYYGPGQSIELIRFKVRTKLEPFKISGNPGRQSHGAVFIGPGTSQPSNLDPNAPGNFVFAGDVVNEDTLQCYGRTPKALIVDLDVEVWNSDREEVRLWNVGDALVDSARIVDHGGVADLVIVNDCGRVEIREPENDISVRVVSRFKPYGSPLSTHKVRAGETWVWPN